MSRGGPRPAKTAPDLVPGPLEIGFAAGFYEGEGSADCRDGSLRVTLPQADSQPLEFVRRYFGGSVNGRYADGMYYLYLYGKRAWDFVVLISPLMSDRRTGQLVRACSKVTWFEGEEVMLCGRPLLWVDRSVVEPESLQI